MTAKWQRRAVLLATSFVAACAHVEPPAEPTPVAAAWHPSPRNTPSGLAQSLGGVREQSAAPVSTRPPPTVESAAIDPLRPTVPIDLDADSARTDLWERIRTGYSIPEIDNELVRKWERWYASRPDYVQRMTDRGSRYLFHVAEELARRDMPTDLALLPFIESAFNPHARSSAKAAGMWQFVAATGRDYSLRQNIFRDDRRDVLASTRAALDYLQSLYAQFHDWQLALAAYNWGQGNVKRAVARATRSGMSGRYEDIRLPDETRNYLPKLQAVKNIVAKPAEFGIALPALGNHPYFLVVVIERDIDVDLAARLAGLPIGEFKQLNPQLNKPVILAAGTPRVLLPYDSANIFVRAIAHHDGPLATWTAWIALRTIRPSEAARLVSMDERELREVNAIPPRRLIRARSTLVVRRSAQRSHDVAAEIADGAVLALAPEPPALKQVRFKVRRRAMSVAAVARRYRVSVQQVASWNRVAPNSVFRPGQVVVLYMPKHIAAGPPTRTAAVKPARKASRGPRPSASVPEGIVALGH